MDVRLISLSIGLWITCALTTSIPYHWLMPFCVMWTVLTLLLVRRLNQNSLALPSILIMMGCICGLLVSVLRIIPLTSGEVAHLAKQHHVAQLEGTVISDPVTSEKKDALTWATKENVRVAIRTIQVRTFSHSVRQRVPILVFGQTRSTIASLKSLVPGERVVLQGSFSSAGSGSSYAALVTAIYPVTVTRGPPRFQSWASHLRERLRQAVITGPPDAAALVPGLTLGDSTTMSPELASAMRNSGLSHLIAVSGANVTLLLSICIGLFTRIIRRRDLIYGLTLMALIAFVIIVRPQPSVLRASVMGVIALLAGFAHEKREVVSALCLTVTVLLVLDPWLARSWGFALSVGATAGLIVWSSKVLHVLDRITPRRLPFWLIETLAVTVCAQIAVFPLLVAMGSQLTLASLPANLIAVPLAGVVMVTGLVLAGLAVVWLPVAKCVSFLATYPAWLIAQIAKYFSAQSWLVIPWPAGPFGICCAVVLLLVGIHIAITWKKLDSPSRCQVVLMIVALMLFIWRPPHPSLRVWPVSNWLMVQCDVGQGDAAVIRTGPHQGVLIDVGPDPDVLDNCLNRLHIDFIPALVLTHFHADHVGGLSGAFRHRNVGAIFVSPLAEPVLTNSFVTRTLSQAKRESEVLTTGSSFQIGAASFVCLWPREILRGQGSDANNASIVLLVTVQNRNLLLMADVESAAQNALLESAQFPRIDAIKISHHGSRSQSTELALTVHAPIALISVGAHNDYGHPAQETISLYRQYGGQVWRTDQHGDLALIKTPNGVSVLSSH